MSGFKPGAFCNANLKIAIAGACRSLYLPEADDLNAGSRQLPAQFGAGQDGKFLPRRMAILPTGMPGRGIRVKIDFSCPRGEAGNEPKRDLQIHCPAVVQSEQKWFERIP